MSLERVVLVDDDTDVRTVAAMALTSLGGLEVDACASGEELLARPFGAPPQLVLLDVMMPGLDGPATLAAMRTRPDLAGVPVVFLTAKTDPVEVARLRGMGAVAVIAKPFDPMTLSDRVRAVWSEVRGL